MVRVGLLLLGGCLVGGGPVIGYGGQGGYLAFEASAGGAVALPQLALGVQENVAYARLDVPADLTGLGNLDANRSLRPVGRIGGGLAFHDDGPTTGIFAAGVGAGMALIHQVRCQGIRAAATVELQVRYQGSWSVALAPRIEGVYAICTASDN